MIVLDIFGLIFGAALILWGGITISSSLNKYLNVSAIVIGGMFVVLAILLMSGVRFA